MDFDNIACTQEYDGDAMDAIFPKKRKTRKRKVEVAENPVFKVPLPDTQTTTTTTNTSSTELDLNQSHQANSQSSQDTFVFTNDNIFKTKELASVLFSRYFPPETLKFTEDELAEINDLYQGLQQDQQQRDKGKLTQCNVQSLDETCLIAKFLEEAKQREADTSLGLGMDLDSPGFSQNSQNKL